MVDVKKLQKELNDYVTNLILAIKKEYKDFLLASHQDMLTKMLATKPLIQVTSLKKENRLMIKINDEILETSDGKNIEALEYDITLFIFSKLVNLTYCGEDDLALFLKDCFIKYFTEEISWKYFDTVTNENNQYYHDFVKCLAEYHFQLATLEGLAFQMDYEHFKEKFYEQTGEDIGEIYEDYANSNAERKSR